MNERKTPDIPLEVLKSIRDEIKGLRDDTNRRFEQMDKRFENMDKRFERIEKDISHIRQDIKVIVARSERDLMLMANDLEKVKVRLDVCEKHLGIQN